MAGEGIVIADHVSNAFGKSPVTLSFASAGVRIGKVVDLPRGGGAYKNQFEVASEFMPFWQAVYPKQILVFPEGNGQRLVPGFGYTTRGVSLTPVQLRLNVVKHPAFVSWIQIACGVLWTARDFPVIETASVNFMPQAGIGTHVFVRNYQSMISLLMPFTYPTVILQTIIQGSMSLPSKHWLLVVVPETLTGG